MRYVEVGGARVSAVGLGTWQFGSPEWGYGADYDSRQANLILNRALDLGVNLIDTAEIYGFGRSEKIVGRALGIPARRSVPREQDPSGTSTRARSWNGGRQEACGASTLTDSTSTNFTSRIRSSL